MIASLLAGTAATTACAPADVLKSRIQSASSAGSQNVSTHSQCLDMNGRQLMPLLTGIASDNTSRSDRRGPSVFNEGLDARLVALDVSFS